MSSSPEDVPCISDIDNSRKVDESRESREEGAARVTLAPNAPPQEQTEQPRKIRCWDVVVTLAFLLLEVPLYVILFGAGIGGIIAAVEQWSFSEGVLYVMSNVLGMGNPLTNVVPKTAAGSIISLYLSLLTVVITGVILNMIDQMAALSAFKRLIVKVVRKLGCSTHVWSWILMQVLTCFSLCACCAHTLTCVLMCARPPVCLGAAA